MRRAGWIVLLLALGAWDVTRRKNADVEEGNARYQQGDWDGAIGAYRKALKELPREPGLHFDIGTALYQKGMAAADKKERDTLLDEAERELRLGTDAEDPKLRSNVHYNLGNALRARDKTDDAIQEYKKALKLDPANAKARHNLELLLRAKQEQEKQKQQQPKDQQDQQPSDQDQQPPQDKPPEQLPPEDTPPQDQQPEPPKDQPAPQTQPQPSEGRPDERKPQDGREWKLDALERLSKDLHIQKQRARARERRLGRPTKDW